MDSPSTPAPATQQVTPGSDHVLNVSGGSKSDTTMTHMTPSPPSALAKDLDVEFAESASITSECQWAQPDSVANLKFKNRILSWTDQCNKIYGGPWQFLNHHFNLQPVTDEDNAASIAARNKFTSWLETTFPELDSVLYQHNTALPALKVCDYLYQLGQCMLDNSKYAN